MAFALCLFTNLDSDFHLSTTGENFILLTITSLRDRVFHSYSFCAHIALHWYVWLWLKSNSIRNNHRLICIPVSIMNFLNPAIETRRLHPTTQHERYREVTQSEQKWMIECMNISGGNSLWNSLSQYIRFRGNVDLKSMWTHTFIPSTSAVTVILLLPPLFLIYGTSKEQGMQVLQTNNKFFSSTY